MKKSKILSILSLALVMIMSLVMSACGELAIKEIQMDKNTFKGVYEVGEEIDYANMQVTAIYEDGSTSTYKLTDDGVSYTPIDTSTVGTKEFKVSVKGYTATLTAVVNPALSSIEIFSGETVYIEGDTIDYSKIMLKAVYGDGSEAFISLASEGVTHNEIDMTTAGEKTLNIEYKGKTTTLKITVNAKVKLESVEIFSAETEFTEGDEIDYTKIMLKAVYDDGSEAFINLETEGVTHNEIDTSIVGEQVLTIEYKGKTTTVTITINAMVVLESIEIFNAKTSYALNEVVDYASIILKANYSNGTASYVNLSADGVVYSQIDTTVAGEKTITIEYQGKTTQLVVKVNEPTVQSIEVESGIKAEYKVGETFNASEIKLKVVKDDANSTVEYVYLNDSEVSYSIDLTSQGNNTLYITYGGVTITKTVSVVAVLQKVQFKVNSLTFVYGDSIDYSTIYVTAVYNDANVNEDIAINSSEVTILQNVNTSTLGEQVLRVEYQGKVAELVVRVNEPKVTSIEIVGGLLNEYNVGGTLNVDEIQLKVVMGVVNVNAIEKHVYLNDSAVSYSIDLTSQGKKTLFVTYGGVTISVQVNVIAVLQRIEFNYPNGLVLDYKEPVDYSTIYVNAIYNDANANKQIALDDLDIEIMQDVDTYELGTHTLKVKYMGKEASIQVEVKKVDAVTITRVKLPQSYIDFKDASDVNDANITETEFAVRGRTYVVGNINKFKFVPEMTYIDMTTYEIGQVENPVTTYELYLKNGDVYEKVDSSLYIDSDEYNMYKFNEFAVGKEFKLVVSPDVEIYNISGSLTATIEFKVENGYNVYDVYGLSVMDNLNVKNWAKIKDRTLVYDDKKLSEYTDVKLVILHNDIAVDADKLPSNYFWSEVTPGYDVALANAKAADNASGGLLDFATQLKGSLRDGSGNGDKYDHSTHYENNARANTYDEDGDGIAEDYAETWRNENTQKGIFNTSQCSISGNYMTVTTKDSATRKLSTVISWDYTTGNTLKMFNPITHWSLFKFFKTGTENLNVSLENVFLQGNMPKVNKDGLLAGLMGVNTLVDELTVDNVITSQFYTHIICDESEDAQSKMNFKNSKMFDAYSNMIYLWRSNVVVENCILKNAGGPLFIICDGERLVAEANDYPEAVLQIDDKTILESYAAGTEAWYKIFNGTTLFGHFKGMNALMQSISGKSYVHKVNGAEQINLIAVIIPDPDEIMATRGNDELLKVKGKFIKGNEVLDISDPIVEIIKSLGSAAFTSNGQYAFMPTDSSVAPFAKFAELTGYPANAFAGYGLADVTKVPGDFANSSSNWLGVTMSAASLGITNAPYFNVIISDFKKV